jgi:DNA methylase
MILEKKRTALNGICPYFTMFPLNFPYSVLKEHAGIDDLVLDPFCGRGTTNYASRLLGLPSVGVDSNPVAVALTQAKLANTTASAVFEAALDILGEVDSPQDMPTGEFWEWAYHKDALPLICRLREGLLKDCDSDARKALRAVLMGALHGPQGKVRQSYFSNQSTRTYAPKPRYSVNYWKKNHLLPQPVDVLEIIKVRAERFYSEETTVAAGDVVHGDSRDRNTMLSALKGNKVKWVITSPPYFGMSTYISDQWLRLWYVGGKPEVDYSAAGQIKHSTSDHFTDQLKQIWQNVGSVCHLGARLIIRIGALNSKMADHLSLIKESLFKTGWKLLTINSAGSATMGRRQALCFSPVNRAAIMEHDVWAVWEGC